MFYLLITLFSLTTSALIAQGDRYEQGMTKAFELWDAQKPMEASNMFERISSAEKENWIPYYYVVQINTIYSFNEKDEEKLTLQLAKAKEFLDKAQQISPDNPELIVLEALINTAWVAYDGQKYGMTLAPKNTELYIKALKIAPENPRVLLSKAEWDMGSARFFGQDTAPFCKDVKKALELFATFKGETLFYPEWGKERAEQILKDCK
ncbi:hypothetical protein GTQ40_17840 [Flavobacteriaceae bacterium R38]|nr:hypothetical protein [Flavobacteriaceae bacterium R38]